MNITLIGMAGVGKSVVGERLANSLGYSFLDIDRIIEQGTGLALQQIIDSLGEDEFLRIEERTVLELGELDNCIISPGGSVVYSDEAMDFLRRNSVIVFLDSSFQSIQERLEDQETRGIVGLKRKSVKALFHERLRLYRRYADLTIAMPDDLDPDAVAGNIIRAVENQE